ncbi:MAG: membrane-bound lytic murein transglycosylase MltF [Methylotenera sp.]
MNKIHHIFLLLSLTFVGCDKPAPPAPAPSVPVVENAKVITFVTMNSPNTYYVNDSNEFAGLEYDLVKLFIKELNDGTQLKLIVANHIDQILPSILNGKADIAAADITVTEARKKRINFTIPYQDVQQQVVYNKATNKKPPKSSKDLVGLNIVVPKGTSFAERLTKLRELEPELAWEERDSANSEKLLAEVANGEIEFTIADSHLISILQNYYPNLGVAFAVGEPEKIAWALSKDADPKLLENANAFFTKIKNDGTLRNLVDRYHGNAKRLNPVDVKTFLVRSNTLLPKYKRLFQQAQEITGIDWRLLAAISYQESHWDTFNTSPTNVRGLMMLTESTADRMGVTDRLDPKQSIPAGAKYINLMVDTIPEHVPQPDRIYMALASYNIGYAHVEDARVLAQRLKLNPNSWADVKKTLVMLNNPSYYVNARYGYCNCGQPVIFVESIRSYHSILLRYQPSHDPEQDNFKIAGEKQILAANY